VQWAEWTSTVPFLVYLAVAIEIKSKLTFVDVKMIALTFIMLSSIGLVSYKLVPSTMIFLAFMAYFALVTVHFNNNNSNLISNEEKLMKDLEAYFDDKRKLSEEMKNVQKDNKCILLNMLIYAVMPYFPIIYLLAYLNIIDSENTLICYSIGSLLGKILFASYLTNSHITLQNEMNFLLRTQVTLMKYAVNVKDDDLRHMIANVAHDLKTV
jgi:ABC-type multidrug transport system fused ATPase/permease subunit